MNTLTYLLLGYLYTILGYNKILKYPLTDLVNKTFLKYKLFPTPSLNLYLHKTDNTNFIPQMKKLISLDSLC